MGCGCRKGRTAKSVQKVKLTGSKNSNFKKRLTEVALDQKNKINAMVNQRCHICMECPYKAVGDNKMPICGRTGNLVIKLANNKDYKCPEGKF